MARHPVQIRKVVAALRKLGLEERRKGSHALFLDQKTGAMVVVPVGLRKDLPIPLLKAITKQLEGHGVIGEEEFLDLLAEI